MQGAECREWGASPQPCTLHPALCTLHPAPLTHHASLPNLRLQTERFGGAKGEGEERTRAGEGHGAGVQELLVVPSLRAVDHDIRPGVSSDEGHGDAWPSIRERVVASDILVLATQVIGLGTLVWIRFVRFPPILRAHEQKLARERYFSKQKFADPEATIRRRSSRRSRGAQRRRS